MKMKNRILLLFLLSFFVISINNVNATGSARLSFSQSGKCYANNNCTITLRVDNLSGIGGGRIASIGGKLKYDESKLVFSSSKNSVGSITYNSSTKMLAFIGYSIESRISSPTNLISYTFTAKSVGNTSVTLLESDISDDFADEVKTSNPSININVLPEPSSNNFLSSLTVSKGSINFNKNTLSYKVDVDENTTNISINGTVEDTKSNVNGFGNKNLNYGNNDFKIVVTAENGSAKTYTVTVNRKDNRSNNNFLKNLSVNGVSITPAFDKNITNYKVIIPFETDKPNIKAEAEDNNAKVSIVGLDVINPEDSKDITVKCIAENGSAKNYVITVVRGKDPNKPLSNNNNLDSITVNQGLLSPVFNKEVNDYVVYLPYEIDNITITVDLSDKKYGLLEEIKPEKLEVGSNIYKYKVTAEDKTVREYTVNVVRNAMYSKTESSALLKNITIINGKLKQSFDKNKFYYTISRKKDYKIEYEKEYESSTVKVVENGKNIYLVVTSNNNEVNVYHLEEKGINLLYILPIITFILGFIPSYFIFKKRK